LDDFIENLEKYNNNEKYNYINYLRAIKNAFEEKNTEKLLRVWQKVDEFWMQIK
jgi:transposase-like protein